MKVLVKGPGQPGELRNFPDDINERLDALKMAVGGYIEPVKLSDRLVAVVREESQLRLLPRNVFGLVGTVVFCGIQNGSLADVPQDDPMLLEVI